MADPDDRWAFGTPEWDAIKQDLLNMQERLRCVLYHGEYVEKVCRGSMQMMGTIKELRARVEELEKENAESKRTR